MRLSALTSPILPCSNLSTARSKALGGAGGSLEIGDAGYVGGVAGARAGSASLRWLATAACSARAAFMIRRRPWRARQSRHRSTRQTGGSPRGALGSGPSKLRECPPPNLRDPPRATSIARPPATTRSVRVVAIPVRMRSTRKSTVNPCASMIASLQPSGDAASSSRARRRSGFGAAPAA